MKFRKLLPLLFGLLLATAALPAQATNVIYGSYGEVPDFLFNAGFPSCATFTGGRSGYARTALTTTAQIPPCTSPNFAAGAQSNLWISFWIANGSSNPNTTLNWTLVGLNGNDGNLAFAVRGTGTNSTLKLDSVTTGGVYTDRIPSCLLPGLGNGLHKLDIHIVYATSGSITVYEDGTSLCTYAGDTTDGVRTGLQNIAIGSDYNGSVGSGVSEVIVADSDTRSMARVTLYPNGPGATLAWANSSGTTPCTSLINATAATTTNTNTNYVSTSTTAQIEQCAIYDTIPTGTWVPLAVSLGAIGMGQVAGPMSLDLIWRSVAGTNYDVTGAVALPLGGYGGVQKLLLTDPATSAAWTLSAISGGPQIGFKSAP